ncbi:arylesterase [Nitratireductor pacificus]|uniref:Lipolytic protein G-D-S-L n=1 Tax=Nitratireductor pacificus pht-3B TaxID=391937 RepID=K2M999_9HYPH|nr:arylesterase [Nitratireductor pacificus]EKF18681.1 lipolytic protein G-D-S-L [Nitratireductor pacificus pht-3B]
MAFKSFPPFPPFTKISSLFLALILSLVLAGAARAEPVRIVGFGDSLMAGYGLGPGEAFPEMLEDALRDGGADVTVANAGVSGDTTSGGLARLEWSVPAEADIVILELGANDMLRGIPPASTEKNLDAIIEKLTGRGQRVVLAGMLAAPNLGPDYAAAFNPIYPRLAEKHGLTLIPFFLDGVAAETALLQSDGMHPNADGVARMVERMLPLIRKTIDEQKEEEA